MSPAGRINQLLRPFGVALVRKPKLPTHHEMVLELIPEPALLLPDGAAQYLRAENPRLAELRDKYDTYKHPATVHGLWSEQFRAQIDLTKFRGHNAYVWQPARTPMEQLLMLLGAYYVKSIDELRLLDRLEEDGQFGVVHFRYMEKYCASRDLLDSVNEINFLERALGISKMQSLSVLDIGAGYGRFIHRLATAFPDTVHGYCVDAVPESTFLSEYYLAYRQVDDRITVVPLTEIESDLVGRPIDMAVNIHSFSECSLQAVTWWLDLVVRLGARYLFLVPNAYDNGGTQLLSREPDGHFNNFRSEIECRGFRLSMQEPKFLDSSLHRFVINTYYYLFERAV